MCLLRVLHCDRYSAVKQPRTLLVCWRTCRSSAAVRTWAPERLRGRCGVSCNELGNQIDEVCASTLTENFAVDRADVLVPLLPEEAHAGRTQTVLVDKLAHAEAETFRLARQLELRRLLEEQSRVSVVRGAVLGMRRNVCETSRERVERERGRGSGEGNVWAV